MPHIRAILNASDDIEWKYWTIDLIVRETGSDVQAELREDLVRLATNPTKLEKIVEVDIVAQEVLDA